MEQKKDISKKLKNKKKDIITFSDTPSTTNKDNKENNQPLSSTINQVPEETEHYTLPLTKNTTFITDKILFQIQLLLSMTDKVDEKIVNVFVPLLSKEHFQNILEERECRTICCNFLCSEKINNKSNGKITYNIIRDEFSRDTLFDYFCSKECFEIYRKWTMQSIEKFDYLNILSLSNIFLLTNIKDYYPENKYLERIADLADNIMQEYLRNNKELKLDNYFQRQRLRVAKLFIDNFDELIKEEEFTNKEEDKKIIQSLFDLSIKDEKNK